MRPALSRTLFYGGTLAVVVLMCQDVTRRAFVSVLGDDTGVDLYAFVRTNVEAPISIVLIALYLDLVLRHRRAAEPAGEAG